MMVVTLFLSLVLASSTASAQGEVGDFGQLGREGVDQPILEKRLSLEGQKRRAYRGGVNNLLNNTVSVLFEDSLGAGVVLDDSSAQSVLPMVSGDLLRGKSLIVTNFHVIESGEVPQVLFAPANGLDLDSGELSAASVLSTVPEKDLALLLVQGRPAHVSGVSVASVSRNNIGDDVEAVGHPKGEMWTYTRGYISQVRADYEWSYNEGFTLKADVVQTQTPISTGNSGGPLFNRQGKLVGVNTMVTGGQNLNFAVSTREFEHLAAGLDEAVEMNSLRKQLDWDSFPRAMRSNYREVGRGKLESGLEYQSFVLNSDSSEGFEAIYRDRSSVPMIFFTKAVDGDTYYFLLDPDHSNTGAWFKARVTNEADDVVIEGWDFDGDFVIDYVI
jgi:S1-C subfamily serine protease